ncbi:MAG TPA: hypothetical protein DCW42_04795 [Bacteroidetes bacterium]|nr:hypothetical protein [Bacteroidota bacterium]
MKKSEVIIFYGKFFFEFLLNFTTKTYTIFIDNQRNDKRISNFSSKCVSNWTAIFLFFVILQFILYSYLTIYKV